MRNSVLSLLALFGALAIPITGRSSSSIPCNLSLQKGEGFRFSVASGKNGEKRVEVSVTFQSLVPLFMGKPNVAHLWVEKRDGSNVEFSDRYIHTRLPAKPLRGRDGERIPVSEDKSQVGIFELRNGEWIQILDFEDPRIEEYTTITKGRWSYRNGELHLDEQVLHGVGELFVRTTEDGTREYYLSNFGLLERDAPTVEGTIFPSSLYVVPRSSPRPWWWNPERYRF